MFVCVCVWFNQESIYDQKKKYSSHIDSRIHHVWIDKCDYCRLQQKKTEITIIMSINIYWISLNFLSSSISYEKQTFFFFFQSLMFHWFKWSLCVVMFFFCFVFIHIHNLNDWQSIKVFVFRFLCLWINHEIK